MQKSLAQIGWQLPLPRARVLQRRLTETRDENRALRLELEAVQDSVEAGINRQAQVLVELQEKIDSLETGRDIAARQVETLRDTISIAVSGQERTEERLTELDDELQTTRDTQRVEMRDAHERVRKQTRRSNGALLAAGLAMLFTAVTAVTGMRDFREYSRILAGFDRDLKDIRSAIQPRLAGSVHEPRSGVAADRTGGSTPGSPFQGDATTDTGNQQLAGDAFVGDPDHEQFTRRHTSSDTLASLEDNTGQTGFISMESGLRYKVLRPGDGGSPQQNDRVVLHFRIFLADGTEIYSTYDKHRSEVIDLQYAAPGLREALPKMEVGSQWMLYVPPELAYGKDSRRNNKYNSEPLVYIVELLSIVEPHTVVSE